MAIDMTNHVKTHGEYTACTILCWYNAVNDSAWKQLPSVWHYI